MMENISDDASLENVDMNSTKEKSQDETDQLNSAGIESNPHDHNLEGQKKSGWYPGKFLGINRKDDHNNKKELIPEEVKSSEEAPTLTSSWFLKNSNNSNNNGKVKEDDEKSVTSESESEEDTKKEQMIVRVVRNIRNKFISRKLIGKIYIYRLSGVISTAMTCDVKLGDRMSHVEGEDDLSDITGQLKRAITTTDIILNSLERRSRAWNGADFNHEVLLTRGTTIGVSDPFLGIIGFSVTLELSATVQSLLASRKRFETAKVLVQKERESSIDPPSRTSFSFFKSFSSSEQNNKILKDASLNSLETKEIKENSDQDCDEQDEEEN